METAFDLAQLWHDLAPRQRALELFGQLGVWDTAHNNGVLIYVDLADRVVETNAEAVSDADLVLGRTPISFIALADEA